MNRANGHGWLTCGIEIAAVKFWKRFKDFKNLLRSLKIIMKSECSFNKWYPTFGKVSIDAVVIPIPNEVLEYLEHGSFHLPVEASDASSSSCGSKWSDGTCVLPDEDEDDDDKDEGAQSPNVSVFRLNFQKLR